MVSEKGFGAVGGLSIVRLSRSFRCAAIRARRGVFGGVSLSLKKIHEFNCHKAKEEKIKTYIDSELIYCRAEEGKVNVIKMPNQSQIQ